MQLDIQLDTAAIEAQLRVLANDIQDKVLVRALNRTAITVRAVVAKEIAATLKGALKLGEVRKALWIVRARTENLLSIVRASGRKRVPLGAFASLKQTTTGVTVTIAGKTYTIPHAFILKRGRSGTWLSKRGVRQVRIRAQEFKPQMADSISFRGRRIRKRGPDLPIAGIYAPGVPAVFITRQIEALARRIAPEKFALVIDQEMRYRTGING